MTNVQIIKKRKKEFFRFLVIEISVIIWILVLGNWFFPHYSITPLLHYFSVIPGQFFLQLALPIEVGIDPALGK